MAEEEKCCYTVLVTQGTSPGVAGELLYNIVHGRVRGLHPGIVTRLYLLATSNPKVVLAAWTAYKLVECCGLSGEPPQTTLVVVNVPDVTDCDEYGEFYAKVREELQRLVETTRREDIVRPGCINFVVLDVTGGRAGMALAAFEAAESVYSRGKLILTTTQVPPERYTELNEVFRRYEEVLKRLWEEETKRGRRVDCDELKREAPEICKLVTRQAKSSVLKYWEKEAPCATGEC